MTDPVPSRPGCGQWLILWAMACWLAIVPLVVISVMSALAHSPPELLVQLELIAPGQSALPDWAFGFNHHLIS